MLVSSMSMALIGHVDVEGEMYHITITSSQGASSKSKTFQPERGDISIYMIIHIYFLQKGG